MSKLALLIGINRYPDDDFSHLQGPVNDVDNLKDLLKSRFDFSDEAICTLINEQATRQGILDAFYFHLIEQAVAETVVVVFYAGHGSFRYDGSGDEIDGWDETIVPCDSGRIDLPNRDITNDELNGLFTELGEKTSHVTYIFDSCYSGTAYLGGDVRAVPRDYRPSLGVEVIPKTTSVRPKFTFLAACRANEIANEHDVAGKKYGVFTYYLLDTIRSVGAGVTYRDIMERTEQQVQFLRPSQHPRLEGVASPDTLVFGLSSRSDPKWYYGSKVGDQLHLELGFVHGAGVGSRFKTYGTYADTEVAIEDQKPIGTATISEVKGIYSLVRAKNHHLLPPFFRAVELSRAYMGSGARVYLMDVQHSPILCRLSELLSAYQGMVRLIPEPQDFDLILFQDGEKIVFEGINPDLISPHLTLEDPHILEKLRDQVLMWARWFKLSGLNHTGLRVELSFYTMADGVETEWDGAVIEDGQYIYPRIRNLSDDSLYFTLIRMDSNSSIEVIAPREGENSIPVPYNKSWPPPGIRESTRVFCQCWEGQKIRKKFKVIATLGDFNLRGVIEQQPVKGTKAPGSGLDDFFDSIICGSLTETVEVPPDIWGTDQLSFLVVPKRSVEPIEGVVFYEASHLERGVTAEYEDEPYISSESFSVGGDWESEVISESKPKKQQISRALPARFLELGVRAARASCRISLGNRYGVGVMIAPRLMLTSHHCLPNLLDATFCRADFNVQIDGDGRLGPVHSFKLIPDKFFLTNKDLDFTLVGISMMSSSGVLVDDFGVLSPVFDLKLPEVHMPLNLIQYPGGLAKQISIRDNRVTAVWDSGFNYSSGHSAKLSDSLIFNDYWQLVALHHTSIPRRNHDGRIMTSDNRVAEYTTSADQIDWIANEAIAVSSILDFWETQSSEFLTQISAELISGENL